MSALILELRLQKCSFEFDSLNLTLPQKSKSFTFPLSICSIDINSKTYSIPFNLTLKGKIIFEGRLDLHNAKASFSSTSGQNLEFLIEIHEFFQSNFKKNIENFIQLRESYKDSEVGLKNFEDLNDYDFITLFRNFNQECSGPDYTRFLESVIRGLTCKVKSLELKSLSKNSNQRLESGAEGRDVKSNSNELEKKDKNLEVLNLQKQVEVMKKEINEVNAQSRLKTAAEEKIIAENQLLKNELIKVKTEQRNFDSVTKQLKDCINQVKEKDKSIEKLKGMFKEQIKSHSELQKEFEKNLMDLTNQNLKLSEEVRSTKMALEEFKDQNDKLKYENSQLSLEVIREKEAKKIENSMKFVPSGKNDSATIKDLLVQIDNLQNTLKSCQASHKQEIQLWSTKCKELEIRNLSFQKSGVREHSSQTRSKLSQSSEATLKCASQLFESLISDSKASFNSIKEIDFKSIFENSSLYDHSEKLSKKLLEYSKTILYYQSILSKIVSILKELKSENFALRERLFFAQNSLPLYIPVRGDPLDFAMAEFVNNLKRPLKIPFVRQDPGFYLFGSRNIRIRLVNNKPFIYAPEPVMVIDEFVNKFTREEIVKFEEQKKIDDKKFATEQSIFPSRESISDSSPLTPALSTSAHSVYRSSSILNSVGSDGKPKTSSNFASHSRKLSGNIPNRLLKKY